VELFPLQCNMVYSSHTKKLSQFTDWSTRRQNESCTAVLVD